MVQAATAASGQESAPSATIARVRLMPALPDPLVVRDWHRIAREYYEQLLNPATRLDGNPLVRVQSEPPGFEIPAYVGAPYQKEALTCLSAINGAKLVGLDPRHLHGFDYVQAAKGWFDPKYGVFRHHPTERGNPVYHADIYGYWAGIQGLILAAQFPDDRDLEAQARSETSAFLRIAHIMGCPEDPNFDVLGVDFAKGAPGGRPEPMNRFGHAPSVAWPLLVGHRLTGDREMLACARSAIRWHVDHPGRYEISHVMGPLTTARLNAEYDSHFDLGRVLDIWYGTGQPGRTPWLITAGTRLGGMTCDGLDAADLPGSERGFYAFTMGTLQAPAWLVPVARYAPRYARDIGRYALHAASSTRLLQGYGLDWDHQDHKDWKDRWDPHGLLFYEGLMSWDFGDRRIFRPYATGDPVRAGWNGPKVEARDYDAEKRRTFSNESRNVALYMGDHVGFLGGIVDETDVPGILRWDCLATDWYHAPAYPTWLFHNPHPEVKTIHVDFGPGSVDLYDAVTHAVVVKRASGPTPIVLNAGASAVLVAIPAGAEVVRQGSRAVANGIVVDFSM